MLSSIGKLATETKEIQAQMRKMAQDKLAPALKEAFQELKKVVPALEGIRWHQYTPYFNDGDVCEFGLHGTYFLIEGASTSSTDYDDGYESTHRLKKTLPSGQVEVLEHFEDELYDIKGLLKEALGDHAKVTVTASGIETEEVEHE